MLSVRDIETKTFSRSKTGYKEEEVENFLDEIIVDYTSLLEEKESLAKKVIALSDKLETLRDEQEARMQSLLSTQKSYDEVMRTAKINSDTIISEANKKAEDILKDAQLKASEMTEEGKKASAELEKSIEDKKAEYNALASEIETVKKAIHVLCDKFSGDVENLPELAKKELKAVTVTAPVIEDKSFDNEEVEAISATEAEIDEDLISDKTKVVPVIKETKVADVPRAVTREKINRALEISEDDYSDDEYDDDYSEFSDESRAEKIKGLFDNSDKEDIDDYPESEEDDFEDEYREDKKKKKFSLFGFGGKKKKHRDDYDDEDYDDYDDEDYDDED